MKAAHKKEEEEPTSERHRAAATLDSGEARAVVLTASALTVFFYFIKVILLPFLLAAIVAYVCTPLLDWLGKHTRLPRWLFAVMLFLLILAVAALTISFAAQHLAVEGRSIASDLPDMVDKLVREALGDQPLQVLGQSFDAHGIAQSVQARIHDLFERNDVLALTVGLSLATVMGAFLTFVLMFYFLVSGRSVARGIFWIVPPHRRRLADRIWTRLDPVLMRYFLGVLVIVIYATIAAYIGLGVILNLKGAVLLALLTGILETVPFIGPTSAAIIAGLVALRAATGIMSILAYALYATVLRLSIDQLVGPIVLGRAAHVHPVLIIFCFLAGAVVLGIPGVILAVPVALLIKSTLATLYGDEAE
jgi:predicted PurR-regulated permease PerM